MRIGLTAAYLFVAAAALGASPSGLARRHEQWLKTEVAFAISDIERTAFLDLASDRDRDAFVHAFWEARDPTPGDHKNERREEHESRVADAVKLFTVDRSRPGALSPRGRIWITLGPPHDRRIYNDLPGLVALEDWLYRGDPALGMPAVFHVVFRYDEELGDFASWNPDRDDPALLIAGKTGAGEPPPALHSAPVDLASALRTLVSVESGPGGEAEAGSSLRLLSRLAEMHNLAPFEMSYLDSIASGPERPRSRRSLPVRALFHSAFDHRGRPMLHYVVEVPPEALTLERVGERLRGGLRVVGWIRPTGSGRPIATIDEFVDLNLTSAELEKVKSFPFAFEDSLSMRPGEYTVDLWVRDLVSLEWGNLTASFVAPADASVESPTLGIGGVLPVAQAIAADRGQYHPFGFSGQIVYPSFEVASSGDLVAIYQVIVPPGLSEPLRVRYVIAGGTEDLIGGFDRLRVEPEGGIVLGTIRTALRALPVGEYRLRVAVDSSTASVEGEVPFHVGDTVPTLPWIVVRRRDDRSADLAIGRLRQELAKGDLAAAQREVGGVLLHAAYAAEARILDAGLALETGDAERSIAVLRALGERPALAAIVEEGIAIASEALGNHEAALAAWRNAVRLAPGSPRYHSRRGRSANLAGEAEEARAALARALVLEPGRADDQALLSELNRLAIRTDR